ncbi:hypothetical protein C8R44DRAFT_261592, partial [Mycena epipterygia]
HLLFAQSSPTPLILHLNCKSGGCSDSAWFSKQLADVGLQSSPISNFKMYRGQGIYTEFKDALNPVPPGIELYLTSYPPQIQRTARLACILLFDFELLVTALIIESKFSPAFLGGDLLTPLVVHFSPPRIIPHWPPALCEQTTSFLYLWARIVSFLQLVVHLPTSDAAARITAISPRAAN